MADVTETLLCFIKAVLRQSHRHRLLTFKIPELTARIDSENTSDDHLYSSHTNIPQLILKCIAEHKIKSWTLANSSRDITFLRVILATWQRSSIAEHLVDSDMKAIGLSAQRTSLHQIRCPACLNDRVLGSLKLAETAHHHIMEYNKYIPSRRSPKFQTPFMRLGAHTLCESYAENDPDLIVKSLSCCRDRSVGMNSFLELGCRT